MKKLLLILTFLTFLVIPTTSIKASVPIKILLVPGHDDEIWGAQYGNVKEAAMNLAVASRIYGLLKKDKRFEVHITRNTDGYTKEFLDYFSSQKDEIITFKENAKKEMQAKIETGDFLEKENVDHNIVSANTAIVLYGINKWANENKMDAVIHIHFNDYPRATKWTIGKYRGFVIYFPDGQLANWKESSLLAADIFTQLRKKYVTSTYKPEMAGLTPDQSLIALGSNDTLEVSVRSVLIEYSYIYEKKFRNYTTRHQAYNDMSNLTTVGIKNYFFPK
jgi:N-acetylmuramoyl-L-alanine amidase